MRATAIARGVIAGEERRGCAIGEAIKLIFKSAYSTLESAPGETPHGTGLSLVRRYVHEAGGKIALASLIGHETRFKFTLPALADAAPVASSLLDAPRLSTASVRLGARLQLDQHRSGGDPSANANGSRSTTPACGAVTVCSIFIASSVIRGAPRLTGLADGDVHRDHRSGQRRHQRSRLRFGGALQCILGARPRRARRGRRAKQVAAVPRGPTIDAARCGRRARLRAIELGTRDQPQRVLRPPTLPRYPDRASFVSIRTSVVAEAPVRHGRRSESPARGIRPERTAPGSAVDAPQGRDQQVLGRAARARRTRARRGAGRENRCATAPRRNSTSASTLGEQRSIGRDARDLELAERPQQHDRKPAPATRPRR